MSRIKYYSNYDMTSGYNLNCSIEKIGNITENITDINDILEYFNILKFFNEELINILDNNIIDKCNSAKKKINSIIGKFCKNITESNIEDYLTKIERLYIEDFFEIFDKYKIYTRIGNEMIDNILSNYKYYLHYILHNKVLVNKYDEILKKHLIIEYSSAELFLDEYEIEYLGNHKKIFFPNALTKEDIEQIMINYINYEFANLNYLRIIVNLQSTSSIYISDKTRLLAKKRVEKDEDKLFDNNSGIEMETIVKFQKNLKQTSILNFNVQKWEAIYNVDWIEENINDYSTLLNNFIYLFEYVDKQMRWELVSKYSYMGIFERTLFMRSRRDYPISASFSRLNQLADLQMIGYIIELEKLDVRLENIIEWFFKEYLSKEFGINNYNIIMPSSNSNYLEKCRTILPEIDSCLKQFNYFVEDGKIDSELLQMSSTHLFFKDVKSLLKNKYVYPVGDEFKLISYYLFSDQCMLAYVESKKSKYKNFYELIIKENIKKDEIVKYEQNSLNKLIDDNYIFVDKDGYIRINNKVQTQLLYDITLNDVISYWKLDDVQRKEIDNMVLKGLLKFVSSLFSKPEQDYLNYYLNKSEFINSLDLRNMYSHGTQPFGNESIHHSNYIKFLKILVLIIIKINDELCINDEINY